MIARLIFVIIVVPFIVGPAPSGGCRWTPSTFFKSLDEDSDLNVSYVEWMKYYGTPLHSHHISECARVDFYYGDCNLDDHLSWDEYYDFRMQGNSCRSSAVKTLRRMYEENPEYMGSLNREQLKKLIAEKYQELMEREEFLKSKYGLRTK